MWRLVFVVVQALMRARVNAGVNAGTLCLTGAASSALTGEIDQLELLPARVRSRGT